MDRKAPISVLDGSCLGLNEPHVLGNHGVAQRAWHAQFCQIKQEANATLGGQKLNAYRATVRIAALPTIVVGATTRYEASQTDCSCTSYPCLKRWLDAG